MQHNQNNDDHGPEEEATRVGGGIGRETLEIPLAQTAHKRTQPTENGSGQMTLGQAQVDPTNEECESRTKTLDDDRDTKEVIRNKRACEEDQSQAHEFESEDMEFGPPPGFKNMGFGASEKPFEDTLIVRTLSTKQRAGQPRSKRKGKKEKKENKNKRADEGKNRSKGKKKDTRKGGKKRIVLSEIDGDTIEPSSSSDEEEEVADETVKGGNEAGRARKRRGRKKKNPCTIVRILDLVETKMETIKEFHVKRIWGNIDYCWEWVPAVGSSGGLLLVW
ncbi:hypothetical protein PIB30_007217 [Stylosanthes scabra]|uniref:Uncharacterized protein n=1 Tax=Stylosanthes scabra TaxID=79078 RepID=A0ABU6V2R0_9FABA|nr:hypothetical protein [Stylosanthes scabra]